ncbi:NAD-dependent epimerase/dehydratase family protein [Pseudomonas asuensis]|uniref:Epimerase n=1 Tax=Pseudomonas asuensis TaxID=1825787 RepID=A0ABQ2H3N2_9PSED|nr:NAD-dependent epimerase/dehydratase family protein [Pseudomonas asuensis]GGM28453.1 epimerase [Pseudomonas asuensis]
MTEQPILITGGAGFIGSHLVDLLLAKGKHVRVLDDFSTGKRDNLPIDSARLEIIHGDVASTDTVDQAMAGCSAVVHLAAVASVQASVDDPVSTHQSNFIGTLNVCEAMRKHHIQRIVFASSAAVYGPNGEGQAIAEDTPKAPLTPYAADKLASEYYLDFYRREHALEPVIFRFFNIYGPRQDPSSPYSGVISIFTNRACQGAPITVYGDGEQTRDFVYVSDLVKLIAQGLEMVEPVIGPVNVGHGEVISLNQLLSEIGLVVGGLPEITHAAARAGDIRHSKADSSRLQSHFAFERVTSMSEGLKSLLKSSS